MNFDLTTTPTEEDARAISDGLVAFNRRAIQELAEPDSGVQFFVFARDDDGTVTGGLRASCFWNVLHIEVMWIAEGVRGNGIGTTLLERAEAFAVDRGYELALLETASWQARPFYEKHGYKLVATIPEYPKGHAMHVLTKRLVPAKAST